MDRRDVLKKKLFSIPNNWEWEWFTDVMDIQGGTQPPSKYFVDQIKENYIRLIQIRDFDNDNHITFIPHSSNLKICTKNEGFALSLHNKR